MRSELYDRSILAVLPSSIPVVSVGNLTVGGTGKTPVASWIARRLANDGMTPAIVLRGYGGDEVLVHRELNPALRVIANADRAGAIEIAAANGATVAVLDDAFQHRRAKRDADIVLVSADDWTGRVRLLPAGPWREPLSAVGRASLVIVTRKAVEQRVIDDVLAELTRLAPDVPRSVAKISPAGFNRVDDRSEVRPLAAASGARVLAISAIGNPAAFAAQLRGLGASVTERVFADHHAFSPGDAARLAGESARFGMTVCTLKDAVKLGSLWPAEAPALWYVSQSITVEAGAAAVDMLLANIESIKSS